MLQDRTVSDAMSGLAVSQDHELEHFRDKYTEDEVRVLPMQPLVRCDGLTTFPRNVAARCSLLPIQGV